MKKSARRIGWFDAINALVFIAVAFCCLFPFYFIFINTISDPMAITRGEVVFLPRGVQFENYVNLLRDSKIGGAVAVSVARTVVGTAITLCLTTFFGYLCSKPQMFLHKFVYRFVIVTMYFSAGLIPWYITMKMLGLKDNFLLYVLPGGVAPFYLILVKTYIEQLPAALEESAIVDGAGILRIFVSIVWPLSMPIIATIAIFTSVGQWNTFTDNLFLVSKPQLTTLQMLLYQYMKQVETIATSIRTGGLASVSQTGYSITPTAVRMTISMIVVFPILLVYPIMQRYFVKGIMVGAIKG